MGVAGICWVCLIRGMSLHVVGHVGGVAILSCHVRGASPSGLSSAVFVNGVLTCRHYGMVTSDVALTFYKAAFEMKGRRIRWRDEGQLLIPESSRQGVDISDADWCKRKSSATSRNRPHEDMKSCKAIMAPRDALFDREDTGIPSRTDHHSSSPRVTGVCLLASSSPSILSYMFACQPMVAIAGQVLKMFIGE